MIVHLLLLLPFVVLGARVPDWPALQLVSTGQRSSDSLLSVTHSSKQPDAPRPKTGNDDTDWLHDSSVATVFSKEAYKLIPSLKNATALDSRTADFDYDTAEYLGRLQSVVYCTVIQEILDWNCTRCNKSLEFLPTAVIFDGAWDVTSYMGYSNKLAAKVIVFRGTDSHNIYNWMEDMKGWRTVVDLDLPNSEGSAVHSGFWSLWNSSSLRSNVTAEFVNLLKTYPHGPTYIVGHSMGGALAQLCAVHLKASLGNMEQLFVYTLGSPRVGNAVFSDALYKLVDMHWRFTHSRDVVPSVPWMFIGYHHSAREVWLVDIEGPDGNVEQKAVVCDESGEDPMCHNSVCGMHMCVSAADHLDYFKLPLYMSASEC